MAGFRAPSSPRRRTFGLGRGPLTRTTDRIESLSRILVLLVVLIAVPVGTRVGSATAAGLRAAAEHQLTTRFPEQATLSTDAPTSRGPVVHYYGARVPAHATWTAPDGGSRSGTIEVTPGSRAGTSVDIWTDAEGRPTDAPLSDAEAYRRGGVAGLATFAGIVLAGLLGHAVVRRQLDRVRHRRWAAEWASVEPVWSRRVP